MSPMAATMLTPSAAETHADSADGPAPSPRRGPQPRHPEILVTTAATGDGVPALLAAVIRHREEGVDGVTRVARRGRAAAQLRALVAERTWARLDDPAHQALVEQVVDEVAAHTLDPYAAADRLLAALHP